MFFLQECCNRAVILFFNKYIVVLITITQELLRHQNFFPVSMSFQDKYMDFISSGDETETVLVLM